MDPMGIKLVAILGDIRLFSGGAIRQPYSLNDAPTLILLNRSSGTINV